MVHQLYAWQNVVLDGTFSFKISVGNLKGEKSEEIPLFVTHHLTYNPVTKKAQSQFRIDFLETWLVPKTKETFCWRQPSGIILTVSTKSQNSLNTVRAHRIGNSQIKITCSDNWHFYYTKGQLTSIHLPNGTIWEVLSQAGRILEIIEKNVDSDITILRGNYLSEKQVLSYLTTQTTEVTFAYEKDLVKLIEIKPKGKTEQTYLFSYQDNLITKIKTPEKTIPISWQKIKKEDFSVLENFSLKPIRVSMIEGKRISLFYSNRGIITEIFSPTDGQTIRRRVNPKTATITEYDNDGRKTIISSGKGYR